jgi:hypothetical protein
VLERLLPLDVMAREPVPAWKVLGLTVGEWMAYAFPLAPEKDDRRRAWGPVFVRLAAAPVEVTLPLATDATHGTLRMKAVRRESPVPATFDVSWRGRRLGVFAATDPASEVEVRVPADEGVAVAATTQEAPRAAPAPPRTVRVAAGAVEEVRFEFPALVQVSLVVLRPGRVPAPSASATIWRDPEGRVPVKALQVELDPRHGGSKDATVSTDLSPGDYGVLVARVAPYLPVWRPFRVEPDAPLTLEVLLEHTGPEATCLLQRSDGAPADGYGLWLGRLDGTSPAQTATVMATSGPDGRINFGPLPDGEYLVADYGNSTWRTLRVTSGLVEPAVLRLPAPTEGTAGAVLKGRVRTPSGEPVRQGLVCVGRADDWRRYAHYSEGRFELKAPAGEAVLTVHHTWFESDLFAPWSRAVVVEAGKDQTFDVRLRAR